MTRSTAPGALKIDFVSDVSCPWCAIGLKSLEQAIERIGDSVEVELHFQPFELNPQMAPQGQDIAEHLRRNTARRRSNWPPTARRSAPAAPHSDSPSTSAIASTTPSMRIACCTGRRSKVANASSLSSMRCCAPISPMALDVSARDNLVRIASEAGLDADRALGILDNR